MFFVTKLSQVFLFFKGMPIRFFCNKIKCLCLRTRTFQLKFVSNLLLPQQVSNSCAVAFIYSIIITTGAISPIEPLMSCLCLNPRSDIFPSNHRFAVIFIIYLLLSPVAQVWILSPYFQGPPLRRGVEADTLCVQRHFRISWVLVV